MTLNFSLKFVSVFKVHACKDVSLFVVRYFRETIETNYGNDSFVVSVFLMNILLQIPPKTPTNYANELSNVFTLSWKKFSPCLSFGIFTT